jgi:hypothetical protein
MCAEASTVLRAVAADFFFNCWCLEMLLQGLLYFLVFLSYRPVPNCKTFVSRWILIPGSAGNLTRHVNTKSLGIVLRVCIILWRYQTLNPRTSNCRIQYWIMNWKGFVRKQSWRNWYPVSVFYGGTEEFHERCIRLICVWNKIRTELFTKNSISLIQVNLIGGMSEMNRFGDKYNESCCLLGYSTVCQPTFRRNLSPPSSGC